MPARRLDSYEKDFQDLFAGVSSLRYSNGRERPEFSCPVSHQHHHSPGHHLNGRSYPDTVQAGPMATQSAVGNGMGGAPIPFAGPSESQLGHRDGLTDEFVFGGLESH